jgi:hypothetical protein
MAFSKFRASGYYHRDTLASEKAPETLLDQGCNLKRLFLPGLSLVLWEDSMNLEHHLQSHPHAQHLYSSVAWLRFTAQSRHPPAASSWVESSVTSCSSSVRSFLCTGSVAVASTSLHSLSLHGVLLFLLDPYAGSFCLIRFELLVSSVVCTSRSFLSSSH